MKAYLKMMQRVFEQGVWVQNRTDIPSLSSFGGQMELDLKAGFPLLTTKQVYFYAVVVELLWFLKGDTNIKYLVDHDVRIWNEWPYQKYCQNPQNPRLTMKEFISLIKSDAEFAQQHGDLGQVYGYQWRKAHGIDQLKDVIHQIKTNPTSRRMIVCSWNPSDLASMALPPCHCLFQFHVVNNQLSCHLYQRSADLFLGVPFNIASYALLTHMIAMVCNLEVGKFVHSFGDLHIYQNHLEQCQTQLTREPFELCQLQIKRQVQAIEDFVIDDFEITNYKHHSKLVGKVAI